MQEWLGNNDILMYSTDDKEKSIIVERFRKVSIDKIYKKMSANDSKSYLPYLNKLVDECKNNYHNPIGKNLPNYYLDPKKRFYCFENWIWQIRH